ncbi:unnamed protein product, partial [marine sediment metagenome]
MPEYPMEAEKSTTFIFYDSNLATGDKLTLPEKSLGFVFTRNVYHHLPELGCD